MCGRLRATCVAFLVGFFAVVPASRAADDAPPASCRANALSEPYTEPSARVSTSALGDLPAGYELDAPEGRPHGVVMIVHGGGWVDVGRAQVQAFRPEAALWVARGWATAIVDHRACAISVDDVVRAYDAIRERVGRQTPIVVSGESSGAHLALVLAARRPDVAAVLARAAPTDAETLGDGAAWDPDGGTMTSWLPRMLADHGAAVFGPAWTTTVSPVRLASAIRARVLYARGQHDVIIPDDQGPALGAALRSAHPDGWSRTMELDPGPVWFVHGGVSVEGERAYRAAELEAVEPWASATEAPERVTGWWAPSPTAPEPDAQTTPPTVPTPETPTPENSTPETSGPMEPAPTDPAPTDPGSTTPTATTPTDPSHASSPAAAPAPPPSSAGSAPHAIAGQAAAALGAAAAAPVRSVTAPSTTTPSTAVASAPALSAVTPDRARRAARAAVRRRFGYRRAPSRLVVSCRAAGAARTCRVSWAVGRSSFRGTVRVAATASGVRTSLRVVRTNRTGVRRRVVLLG